MVEWSIHSNLPCDVYTPLASFVTTWHPIFQRDPTLGGTLNRGVPDGYVLRDVFSHFLTGKPRRWGGFVDHNHHIRFSASSGRGRFGCRDNERPRGTLGMIQLRFGRDSPQIGVDVKISIVKCVSDRRMVASVFVKRFHYSHQSPWWLKFIHRYNKRVNRKSKPGSIVVDIRNIHDHFNLRTKQTVTKYLTQIK